MSQAEMKDAPANHARRSGGASLPGVVHQDSVRVRPQARLTCPCTKAMASFVLVPGVKTA